MASAFRLSEMDVHRIVYVPLIIFCALQVAIAGRAEAEEERSNTQTKSFADHAFQNLLREAGEFLGNLSAAKTASAAADAKLSELRNALTNQSRQTNKGSAAILLPSGWDKKTIVDAITKALSQSKQYQELSDKFDRFMSEIKKLEDLAALGALTTDKAAEFSQSKNKTRIPGFGIPVSLPFGNLNNLDNATLAGKLVGFIKTGRHLGSFEFSELNPCSKGSCDKWKKGLSSLRDFLSKSSSKLGDFFKNAATLRIISEEANDSKSDKAESAGSGTNKDKRVIPSGTEAEASKSPIDYFDYYYNGEETSSPKPPAGISNRNGTKTSVSNENVNASSSNPAGAQKALDYFDYYYNQGVPPISSNRTRVLENKLGA